MLIINEPPRKRPLLYLETRYRVFAILCKTAFNERTIPFLILRLCSRQNAPPSPSCNASADASLDMTQSEETFPHTRRGEICQATDCVHMLVYLDMKVKAPYRTLVQVGQPLD